MTKHAYDRVSAGLSMPGILAIKDGARIAEVILDLIDIADLSLDGEWEGQVRYLPLSPP